MRAARSGRLTGAETCNGVDDDCDDVADEDYQAVPTACGVGLCARAGSLECRVGALVDTCTPVNPIGRDDDCDGEDEDCDSRSDEGFADIPASCGVGDCTRPGAEVCVNGATQLNCIPGNPVPGDATCNDRDEDCDGGNDEGYVGVPSACGVGACTAAGVTSCAAGGVVQTNCTPGMPSPDTTCDDVDDDCNGVVDEDYPPVQVPCPPEACAPMAASTCVAGVIGDSCRFGEPGLADDTCDGEDDDCDGSLDEDYQGAATMCGNGPCRANGEFICVGGGLADDCQPDPPPSNDDQSCDGTDDDCDGFLDEDYTDEPSTCGVGECAGSGVIRCIGDVEVDDCVPLQPGQGTCPREGCDQFEAVCRGSNLSSPCLCRDDADLMPAACEFFVFDDDSTTCNAYCGTLGLNCVDSWSPDNKSCSRSGDQNCNDDNQKNICRCRL